MWLFHSSSADILHCLILFQIRWFKDGRELRSGGNVAITYSLGICSLELQACTLEDAGRYTLRAENSKGDAETQCKVTVNGRDAFFIILFLSVLTDGPGSVSVNYVRIVLYSFQFFSLVRINCSCFVHVYVTLCCIAEKVVIKPMALLNLSSSSSSANYNSTSSSSYNSTSYSSSSSYSVGGSSYYSRSSRRTTRKSGEGTRITRTKCTVSGW